MERKIKKYHLYSLITTETDIFPIFTNIIKIAVIFAGNRKFNAIRLDY